MAVIGPEAAAQTWDHYIANYELTEELLPRSDAPWDELVYFAGTFDGTVPCPTATGLRGLAWEWRQRFLADGTLPDGLTMLRALLHGEQRLDYWSEEPGEPEPNAMRHIQHLANRVRELVLSGAHLSPDPTTVGGVQDKVMNAFDRLLVGYAAWGGHRYHGWTSYEDQRNYHGPVIWSERDCDLRFAFELEREWPQSVHVEFAIGKSSRLDYDKDAEGVQRVDVAVSDLSTFIEDEDSFDRFRNRTHEAFFEVKWFTKGWTEKSREVKTRLVAVPVDLAKLANHQRLERCVVAGMLVVDDDGVFEQNSSTDEWPAGVWRLYVGPSALVRRGLLSTEPSSVSSVACDAAPPNEPLGQQPKGLRE